MISLTIVEFVFACISIFVSGIIIGVATLTIIDAIRAFRKKKDD